MKDFRLEWLRLSGFRGYAPKEGGVELRLDGPSTVILGRQGGAKSSTLVAIGWCLFGDKVAKKSNTGITERKNWLVRHRLADKAWVELGLRSEDGVALRIFRTDRKKKGKAHFFFTLDGGPRQTEEEALHALLGVELADYMSCVHLHQEVIPALLVEEPKERKKALDRLMGLTEQRNFVDGLKNAKLLKICKDFDRLYGEFGDIRDAKMEARRGQLIEAKMEARGRGLKEFSLSGAQALAAELSGALDALAQALDVQREARSAQSDREGLSAFVAKAREEIRVLRRVQLEHSGSQALRDEREQLEHSRFGCSMVWDRIHALEEELTAWTDGFVDTQALVAELTELSDVKIPAARAKAAQADLRAALMREVARWMAEGGGKEATQCPVCRSEPFVPEEVEAHLETWQQELDGQTSPALEEVAELEARQEELRRILQRVGSLQEELEAQHEERRMLEQALEADWGPLPEGASGWQEELGRRLEENEAQLERVGSGSEAKEREAAFNGLEDRLEDLRWLVEALSLREDVDALKQIEESEVFADFAQYREQAHVFHEHVKLLHKAAQEALSQEAEEKLTATRAAINTIYAALSTREDFAQIEIDPAKYEVMLVRGEEREGALRLLNKGDINCAALSIFLALATSTALCHKLGFIILDDPTQCLDAVHKERLAGVLAQVAQEKQLLLATSEQDFYACVEQKFGTTRTYRIEHWSPEDGPQLALTE